MFRFVVGNEFLFAEVRVIFFAKEKEEAVDRHSIEFQSDETDQPCSEHPNANKPKGSRGEHKGLCMNCANRDTCLYPKPEGGVWHCEEYTEDR
jgi:hypothetical protein